MKSHKFILHITINRVLSAKTFVFKYYYCCNLYCIFQILKYFRKRFPCLCSSVTSRYVKKIWNFQSYLNNFRRDFSINFPVQHNFFTVYHEKYFPFIRSNKYYFVAILAIISCDDIFCRRHTSFVILFILSGSESNVSGRLG